MCYIVPWSLKCWGEVKLIIPCAFGGVKVLLLCASPMVFEVLRGGLNVLYHVSKLVFEVLHRLKGRCALSLETLFEA